MAVYVVQSTDLYPEGKRRYWYIETYHPTMEAFASDLRGGPVAVQQLFASLVDGEYVVRDRRPLLLSPSSVHHAYEPDRPFVEYEEPVNV